MPGETPDPYRVWISEIMLQQTRVETAARYYERFLDRFPTLADLAAARLGDVLRAWAGLGYYARARNLHACAREVVARHGGHLPSAEQELRALPGIGPYTAAAIAAIAFGRRAVPVDGNVERVVARLYAVEQPLPAARARLRRLAEGLVPDVRAGDFAQALMDLGATVCTPRRPDCPACPWRGVCLAARRGDPVRFPRRSSKREGRLRRGAAYFLLRADGAVLVRRRPRQGLLGGMIEVPTTEWVHRFDEARALRAAPRFDPSPPKRDKAVRRRAGASPRSSKSMDAEPDAQPRRLRWRRLPGVVRHVFSHFPLELMVLAAEAPRHARAPRGMRFVKLARLDREALPTLMRKVVAHALRSRPA